eukprot:CCRYP_005363-RB/>CCRYP_005363-RB protein AED:0.37 eAED:0.37 QI:2143/0.66/0.75/1/0.66/0.5/4/0/119
MLVHLVRTTWILVLVQNTCMVTDLQSLCLLWEGTYNQVDGHRNGTVMYEKTMSPCCLNRNSESRKKIVLILLLLAGSTSSSGEFSNASLLYLLASFFSLVFRIFIDGVHLFCSVKSADL